MFILINRVINKDNKTNSVYHRCNRTGLIWFGRDDKTGGFCKTKDATEQSVVLELQNFFTQGFNDFGLNLVFFIANPITNAV